MNEIERALASARQVIEARGPFHGELKVLADIVERAREWFADVDLVYPSQTEQAIRNALREILEGPDA